MTDKEKCDLRLECLKLAHHPDALDGQSVDLAREYADYLLGTNDADIVRAARELAKKIGDSEDVPDRLKTASELYGKLPPFVPLGEQSE